MSFEEFFDGGDTLGEVLDTTFAEVCVAQLDEFADLFWLGVFGDGYEHDV